MTADEVRQKYLKFFEKKEHKEIKPAPLVLEGDITTLFTSSGMQPLIPYLMGKKHPDGTRLVNSQPCFRAEDITEIGDNRHTTFFEMLGNWSLGEYFKKEQLGWFYQFITSELGLNPRRLHVTVFEGNNFISKDEETFNIWKELGIPEERIYFYGIDKNWWSRSGSPDQMPVGEIGGTDSEVFYEFPQVAHDPEFGDKCHPHCDCGHFMEIGNSVFIEYIKKGDGDFQKLPQKNVDFGGGLERQTAATEDNPDIFQIDLNKELISVIEQHSNQKYDDIKNRPSMRVIADHLKAATFFIVNGVRPSNKLQGYVLRRLLRRSAIKMHQLKGGLTPSAAFCAIADETLKIYEGNFGINRDQQRSEVFAVMEEEMDRFGKSMDKGLKQIEKIEKIDGKIAFDLYQTYGFPYEITEELFGQKGQDIDHAQYEKEFKKHQELSRTASAGLFKGGLAGHSETEVKYHTATHLLHQALRDVLGDSVIQQGSNITPERLRFDFKFDRKLTEEEVKKVEQIVNEKIKDDLTVDRKFMGVEEAKKMGAIGLFDEKYGAEVSIYMIGPNSKLDPQAKDQRDRAGYYSMEFCGGPHVEHTGMIGKIKITKEEAISAGVRRIRAELV